MSTIKKYFLNLNLFALSSDSNETQTDQHRRWNIIGTRVYLILLTLTLVILTLIISLLRQTTIIIIKSPTREQFDPLPADATCSCSQISIPYGKFVSLNASFHQVCSSDFVSDRWIKAIDFRAQSELDFLSDFRAYGSAQFQMLAVFCRLSKSTIEYRRSSLFQSTILSPQVLKKDDLQFHVKEVVNQVKLKAPKLFQSQIRLINEMVTNNHLVTALMSNFIYHYQSPKLNILYLNYDEVNGNTCECDNWLGCRKVLAWFFKIAPNSYTPTFYYPVWSIPGISDGCLPTYSLLLSTLECFYDQLCVDEIMSYFPTNQTFKAMTPYMQSIFTSDSDVQTIVAGLMIEQWMTNMSYDEYYQECAPSSCNYLHISRRGFVYALEKVVSLLPSLILMFELIISLAIRLILKIKDRTPIQRMSFKNRLRSLKNFTEKIMIELNIFKRDRSTHQEVRFQRYATRIYICLLIAMTSIFTFYTFLTKSPQSKTVHDPTELQFIYLEKQYPRSLSCSCSSALIPYSDIIKIQPQYHQLCTSDLISDRWIKYIDDTHSATQLPIDYRFVGSTYFKLLSIVCRLANETITNALDIFLQSQFISSQVISEELFENQMNSLIEDWKATTLNTFKSTIQLIRQSIDGNQLISADHNFSPVLRRDSNGNLFEWSYLPECDCILNRSCLFPITILYFIEVPYVEEFTVPNIFRGCYPIHGLFSSTLQSFYNLSIMTTMHYILYNQTSFDFSPLDPNLSSYTETIETLVNRMMIDGWPSNVSFASYFNICAPHACSYQYQGRSDLFFIIATIISVFSGISLGLNIIIQILLQLIYKLTTFGLSRSILRQLFTCDNQSRIIRRLHILLVIGILTGFCMFSAFTPRLITVQVNKPSLPIYKNLLQRSSYTLECSCSQLSVKHKSFLNITPIFHAICSSEFVSNEWISYLFHKKFSEDQIPASDFLYSAVGQFQSLSLICQLSKETVMDAILQLGISDFVNNQLLSFDALHNRIETMVKEFQLTMPETFVNSFSIVRGITNGNMLMSVYMTNWVMNIDHVFEYRHQPHIVPLTYDKCSCSSSATCTSSSRGMLTGCYPLEALLQSTLSCLYDQQCIDPTSTFKAMNMSSALLTSRFALNETIESLVNSLMVEKLMHTVSYEDYFEACSPSLCVYSYVDERNMINAVTTLTGLFGGVAVICQLVAMFIVKRMCKTS
ncbi:unnamed protein product [Adineta ricciae]|uniref:Uncharacterized protein n=1 Tax=Adineta ricciae TaxID=249248 RepID=A0A815UA54_ADIRI|nr:unnamed protein product [Adineta ricciae]CAF1519673.1 unnamed protein product [Adineta ricciae]